MFLPLKPSRYGFLFTSLGDSVNAFIYRSHIYAGRPTQEPTEHYIQGNTVFFFFIVFKLLVETILR
jgi:hypothetical protein